MKNLQIINVLGYGYTGSGAIIDLLKEIETCKVVEGEFDLIRGPYGLIDLKNNVINSSSTIRANHYIRKFIQYACVFKRKNIKGIQYGYNYGESFQIELEIFLSKIIDIKFKGTWHFHYIEHNFFTQLLSKVYEKIGIDKNIIYMTDLSNDKFQEYVRTFLYDLLKSKDNKYSNIVLDQSIDVINPKQANYFFNNYKNIIVDRDPRDVYIDALRHKWIPTDDINLFCRWYEINREKEKVNDSNNIYIKFEDIVLDYDNTLNELYDFLNVKNNEHLRKKHFFQPEKSAKNIGKWKNIKNMDKIKIIEKKLNSFLYIEKV
ncbi:MAG: Unknown protein [uncultured Campylobacterales bacterium]|uniref:Sulfotransferase domain-containing protein n=1 Tax=uncultured Campylobacterales bacterium TaxID=352960 RepID=A0A6S6SV82_9BACT|nr:MAG: Unknown protein [uncultured Campylobacterales bacterium]